MLTEAKRDKAGVSPQVDDKNNKYQTTDKPKLKESLVGSVGDITGKEFNDLMKESIRMGEEMGSEDDDEELRSCSDSNGTIVVQEGV